MAGGPPVGEPALTLVLPPFGLLLLPVAALASPAVTPGGDVVADAAWAATFPSTFATEAAAKKRAEVAAGKAGVEDDEAAGASAAFAFAFAFSAWILATASATATSAPLGFFFPEPMRRSATRAGTARGGRGWESSPETCTENVGAR